MKKYTSMGCLFFFFLIYNCNGQTNKLAKLANKITSTDLIASVQINNWQFESFEHVFNQFAVEQIEMKSNLLKIFNDPKSSNLNQYCAACYIGELKVQEAVTNLAAKIKLSLNDSPIIFSHLPNTPPLPAMTALIKIGAPSIPAVLRNLAESDDVKVRELSLQVIVEIDKDQDISILRLQKAVKVETDAQKQTRLQAALKTLTGLPAKN